MQNTACIRSVLFKGDFSGPSLVGFTHEQHTPDGYPDFLVRSGRIVMFDLGNRLLAIVPRLTDCRITGSFEADWDANEGKLSFIIHFDHDRLKRTGKELELRSRAEVVSVAVRIGGETVARKTLDDRILAEVLRKQSIDFSFEATETNVNPRVASHPCFSAPISRSGGAIAFSRGGFPGELRMSSLDISSNDPFMERSGRNRYPSHRSTVWMIRSSGR